MTREEQFALEAAKYLSLHKRLTEAQTAFRQAEQAERTAREAVERMAKELGEYVGSNVRTRNAVVGGQLVRVEHRGDLAPASVAVEEVFYQPA